MIWSNGFYLWNELRALNACQGRIECGTCEISLSCSTSIKKEGQGFKHIHIHNCLFVFVFLSLCISPKATFCTNHCAFPFLSSISFYCCAIPRLYIYIYIWFMLTISYSTWSFTYLAYAYMVRLHALWL